MQFKPEPQECKWLYATSYKIAIKLYQQQKYQESLPNLYLALSVNKLLYENNEEQDILKHVKEVYL